MRRTTMLWEVFVRRFEEAFEQYEKHLLSSEEAGELLGMSGRNFRRLCVRYEEDGVEGLRDRRIGKVLPRRAAARELERMHELYRERYSDFSEALPRAAGEAAPLQAVLHGDQGVAAGGRAGGESQASGRPPQEAGAAAAAGNAAVSGRLDPSLDCGAGARSRPRRHPRRCHRVDLFGAFGRAGRHDVELAGLGRDDRAARPVWRALHRSGWAYFITPKDAR